MKSQKVTFQKSQKLLAENLRKRPYSYSFNFKGGFCIRRAALAIVRTELRAWEASSFCFFIKVTSFDFTLFYSLWTQENIFFLEVCLVRSILANLCPIIIYYNALDFNVCRSGEVISFF